MKVPIPSCPYKTKDGQCLKGWYMIPILTVEGKLKWECPKCKEFIYQRNENYFYGENRSSKNGKNKNRSKNNGRIW